MTPTVENAKKHNRSKSVLRCDIAVECHAKPYLASEGWVQERWGGNTVTEFESIASGAALRNV